MDNVAAASRQQKVDQLISEAEKKAMNLKTTMFSQLQTLRDENQRLKEALVILQTKDEPKQEKPPTAISPDDLKEQQHQLAGQIDRWEEEKRKFKQIIRDQESIIGRLQSQLESSATSAGNEDIQLLRLQNSILKNRVMELEQRLLRLQEEHDSLLDKQISGYRQNQLQNIMSAAVANAQLMALRSKIEEG